MFKITINGLDPDKFRRQVEEQARRAVADRKREIERSVGMVRCPIHGQRPQIVSTFTNEVRFKVCCEVLNQLAKRTYR